MPVYEYECRECESRFDRLVTMQQADLVACPACGAKRVRRLVSVIAGLGRGPEPQAAAAPVCGQGACEACS